jgi:hypothetical protein
MDEKPDELSFEECTGGLGGFVDFVVEGSIW